MKMILPLLTVLLVIPFSASFSFPPTLRNIGLPRLSLLSLCSESSSSSSSPSPSSPPPSSNPADVECGIWKRYATINSIATPKLSIRPPLISDRGKGGVHATSPIAALEVIARIPRRLIVAASDLQSSERGMEAASDARVFSWAVDLTAAVLVALHPTDADTGNDGTGTSSSKRGWIAGWEEGGWATSGIDLGPPEAKFGSSCVTGSLLSTGSDNDHNVFAKFRLPSHPVLHRASIGLALLTGAQEDECLNALVNRGKAYRGMRDGLLTLVNAPSDERKGSLRERRAWDVADALSRVLARATVIQMEKEPTSAVVPLHERLAQTVDARGQNAKLVYAALSKGVDNDNDGDDNGGGDILLVATRDIEVGEAITRDYADAPRLEGDTTEGALSLLLQFGLPPSAWTTVADGAN